MGLGGETGLRPVVPGDGRVLEESVPASPDPMAAPHVDVSAPLVGGSIRLRSASGGLEALWVHLRDEEGDRVVLDPVTCAPSAPAVRITPTQARALSDLLRRYADTHRETPDE